MSGVTAVLVCIMVGVGIYLWMIMPRIVQRTDREAFVGVLYAHRGLYDNSSDAPENSLAAFQKAVEGGYGIELDVRLSRDRVPVVFHDETLKRMCGKEGRVCEYTYEELLSLSLCGTGERIPGLKQVLELVGGRVPLIIEYKIEACDHGVCHVCDGLLQKYDGAYCIESFNPLALVWYRRHRPGVMRGQLSDAFYSRGERRGMLYFALEKLLFNFLGAPDFVAYNHREARRLSRRLCRSLYGNMAVAWNIKTEAELIQAKKSFDMFIFDSFIPSGGSRL